MSVSEGGLEPVIGAVPASTTAYQSVQVSGGFRQVAVTASTRPYHPISGTFADILMTSDGPVGGWACDLHLLRRRQDPAVARTAAAGFDDTGFGRRTPELRFPSARGPVRVTAGPIPRARKLHDSSPLGASHGSISTADV